MCGMFETKYNCTKFKTERSIETVRYAGKIASFTQMKDKYRIIEQKTSIKVDNNTKDACGKVKDLNKS